MYLIQVKKIILLIVIDLCLKELKKNKLFLHYLFIYKEGFNLKYFIMKKLFYFFKYNDYKLLNRFFKV